jgi:murein DD-endopeptidase MepM/ murein hydrolase activator NlpD
VNRRLLIVIAVVLVASAAIAAAIVHKRSTDVAIQHEEQLLQVEAAHEQQVEAPDPPTAEFKIGRNENFAAALQRSGLSAADAANASTAAQRVFNLRQVRAGNSVSVNRSAAGELREIDYRIDLGRMLKIVPASGGAFSAEVRTIPSKTEVSAVNGKINDSLFNAVAQAGESPELAMWLAQIFGYDLDFYNDPRKGDTFRVVLEKKKYENGQNAGYGKILAAEYNNGGKKYQALLFHDETGRPGYYSADGKALQKTFLRSPLKFTATITSHFSKSRYHPLLKIFRPHMGTDFGAPIGTPVQTIGSGRVEFAGRKGGEGNMIQIAHSDGYQTMYLHLSRMFVHQGERVEIGKTIGLVGSTGLSTGPHLDFRILQRGQYKNFEKLGLPPSDPITKKAWSEFALVRQHWLPLLEGREVAESNGASANPAAAATAASAAESSAAAPPASVAPHTTAGAVPGSR